MQMIIEKQKGINIGMEEVKKHKCWNVSSYLLYLPRNVKICGEIGNKTLWHIFNMAMKEFSTSQIR